MASLRCTSTSAPKTRKACTRLYVNESYLSMSNTFAGILETLRRELERTPQHGALRHQFSVLERRGTVGDDTSPSLVAVGIASKHQRADGDRLVHIAVPSEIAHRAAVQLPAHRLELISVFPRTPLERAHQCPPVHGCL